MIHRRRRELLWIPLFWFIPLLGVLACWRLDAPSWLWVLAIIALVSGIIQHLSSINQLQDWKKRLQTTEDDEAGRS